MKRILKRITVALQILLGRRQYVAMTYNDNGALVITNMGLNELEHFGSLLCKQVDDTICDPAITELTEVLCLN